MNETQVATVEAALLALASLDADMARYRNDVGFNAADTAFGNSLARQIRKGKTLTPRQTNAAYRMLQKYRDQLGRLGVDYSSIPTPDEPPPRKLATGTGTLTDGKVVVTFDGFPEAGQLDAIRAVPGRRFHKPTLAWHLPLNPSTVSYLEVLPSLGVDLEPAIHEQMLQLDLQRQGSAALSRATDADLDMPLASRLMPFQRAGVVYAVQHGRTLLADEMGLGKTVQALAALEHVSAYPALVVVPAVVKLNWLREAGMWVPHRSVHVVNGRTPYELPDVDLVVINYDLLDAWRDHLRTRSWQALVADESHYLKNSKAKRTKAMLTLAKAIPMRLLLTGTPILNRPVELISQLNVLGRLAEFGGFWPFAQRYCGAVRTPFGWDLTGSSNLSELHERLRSTCLVRRTKEQVLTELPPKRRAIVPVEMRDPARYARTVAELRHWLKERLLADEDFRRRIAEMDPTSAAAEAERVAFAKAQRLGRAEQLVKIEALKQVCVEEKLVNVTAWIEDFLASGRKLVVFASHRATIDELHAAFGEKSVTLTGQTLPAGRQEAVDRFQDDPSCTLFLGNIQAAGVGITLTAASDVAFVELPWRPGDLTQAEDRCHRIGQDDSVTAWYLLAAGTIEEKIAGMLDTKRAIVDEATDGVVGLDPDDSLLDQLVAEIKEER